MSGGLLYLGAEDIAALDIGPAAVLDATAAILRQRGLGATRSGPKLAVDHPALRTTAQAMVAMADEPGLSLVKVVGVAEANAARGLPTVHATVVLSDLATGQPRTVMSATWLTGVRTAACSALGARHLARPDAATVLFVGCGLQAHTHLDALLPVLPELRRALLLGRSTGPVERLATAVRAAGLSAAVATDPAAALAEADVVVSTVPASPGLERFLDPAALRPGAFVSAVDLGRSWHATGFRDRFAVLATDDAAQSRGLAEAGKMVCGGPFDAELGDLVSGTHPGRTAPDQVNALVFAGTAVADLGLAALIDRRARDAGAGRLLPA